MKSTIISNELIQYKEIRLIGPDGSQVDVLSTNEAKNIALNYGLDLILINPEGNPPVCKLVDLRKYKYSLIQHEKNQKKKQRESQIVIKEINLKPVTALHDIAIKAKKIIEFLNDGYQIKIQLKFKGRELTHKEQGEQVFNKLINLINTEFNYIEPLAFNGRMLYTKISK